MTWSSTWGKNVEKYCTTVGVTKARLTKADTPFLDESKGPQGCADEVGDSL